MKAGSLLPFGKRPKQNLVAVGNDEIGIIYLHKINGRTTLERKKLDSVDEIETKLQLTLYKLAKKIAEDNGCTPEEALQLIFTEDVDSIALQDYSEELEKMLALKKQTEEFKDLVVTTMIQERIAYPVIVASTCRKGETRLLVEELGYDIPVKTAIRFDSTTCYTASQAAVGDSEILLDEPLLKSVEEAATGFLVDDRNTYLVGNDEWTIEDTGMLPDSISNAIFEFYQGELTGGSKEPKKGLSKNPSKSSKNTSKDLESTGDTSTGEPEDIEVLTMIS